VIRLRCGDELRQALVVAGSNGRPRVTIDGVAYSPEVEEVAPGRYVLVDGASRERFECVRDGDAIHLFWRGVAYRLEQEREGARALQRHAAGSLEAPMPGKVIAVRVSPGQRVKKGHEVLVIEAMKMENALRAPLDGTVKTVAVAPGDMVSPGVVLVEIE